MSSYQYPTFLILFFVAIFLFFFATFFCFILDHLQVEILAASILLYWIVGYHSAHRTMIIV